jgi:Cell Wall Hydrolase
MRIRRLLFLLVPIILGGTIPLHAALGPAPLCLAPAALQATPETVDVKPPIPQLGHAVANYEPDERDYLIRTIAFEAPDESDEGKAAVAHVILNRKRNGRWGDNIKDVVTRPWQFEPWMTRRKEMKKLSPYDPRYQNAARIADAVLTGQMPDPTAGATHFLNPTVVRQRRDGSLPSWARGEGQPIGRHTFYSPNEGSAGSARAAQSMGALGDPLRIDTSSQPLTRADCGKAGMLWDEGGNVCTESTSTELSQNTPEALVTNTGGGVLNALGEPESKSNKRGESLAAVHTTEIAAVESRAKVETAAPRSAKPKTAKSPTPNRPNVAAAETSSKSKQVKHVKSGGSRRAGAARSSTKSSVRTVSKNSVKSASKSLVQTVSKSSVKSASKSSVRTVSKSSVKSASKSSVKTASKSPVKSASKSSVKTAPRSAVKSASIKSSVKTAAKEREQPLLRRSAAR